MSSSSITTQVHIRILPMSNILSLFTRPAEVSVLYPPLGLCCSCFSFSSPPAIYFLCNLLHFTTCKTAFLPLRAERKEAVKRRKTCRATAHKPTTFLRKPERKLTRPPEALTLTISPVAQLVFLRLRGMSTFLSLTLRNISSRKRSYGTRK